MPSDLVSRGDLRDEKPATWTDAEITGPNTIRVHFTTGDPTCYGARAEVNENSEQVQIAVFVGTLPGAPNTCTMVGALSSMSVTTQDPVGDRSIVEKQ